MPLVAVRLQWGHSTFSDVVVVSWVGAGWVFWFSVIDA